MDQPIRCYTCGTILHPIMYKTYSDCLDAGLSEQKALRRVKGLNKDCFGCNRMMLSHIPLVEDQIYFSARKRPASFQASLEEYFIINKKTKTKKKCRLKSPKV